MARTGSQTGIDLLTAVGKHPIFAGRFPAYYQLMYANNLLRPESPPRQRILVVDDDQSIQQLNRDILTHHEFDVSVADDGAAAWDELQQNRYDLLITDNDMPRLSGMGLIRRLHDAHLTLPIIMVTGTSPQEELARHPELQVEALLLKPYSMDELLSTVKNVLRAYGHGRTEITPPARQQHSSVGNHRLE